MSTETVKLNARLQNKHDLEANWNLATFIPFPGELIIYDTEVDADGNNIKCTINGEEKDACAHAGRTVAYTYERFKIGDGIHTPADLPFSTESIENKINNHVEELNSQMVYTNADPVITTLGGITAGTTFEDVPIKDLLTNLLYPYTKPVINSFTLTPSAGVKKKGVPITLTNASTKITKKSKAISKVDLYNGSTLLKSIDGSSITSAGTTLTFSDLNDTLAGTSNTTYTIKVSEENGTADVVASTATYTFVDPYYKGVISKDAEITAELISGLTEIIEAKGTKSYSFTTTSEQCSVIAYPASYGTIKEIKDANNFTQAWPKYDITINGVPYYVYVSGAAAATNFIYKFSY